MSPISYAAANDRVDNDLNAIKGGGAAQLREKVLAEAAKTWVIVADYRKNSHVLGTNVSLAPEALLMNSGRTVSLSKSRRSPTPKSS